VEQQMCSNQWDSIEFGAVPSKAHSNYRTAFVKHQSNRYRAYLNDVQSGKEKINASAAVYPYEILKPLQLHHDHLVIPELVQESVKTQWEAMENWMEEDSPSVFPVVDVSGSMGVSVSGANTSAMEVAISFGLYFAEKQKNEELKDCFMTFSEEPEFCHLKGNILHKSAQMSMANWGMNTNLELVFDTLLHNALRNKVPSEEMPKVIIIFSDMQFDRCVHQDETAMEMIQGKFVESGYTVPTVVFWNINAYEKTFPVQFDKKGTVLVSGFSPVIAKTILTNVKNLAEITPESIMKKAVLVNRYNW
jgi:hypothetical protein